jgi:hypothetical protein
MKLNKLALAGALIAALLVGPLSAPVSAAVIKPGASCAKIGNTATYKSKKYKCIKSGSKKIWDKGKTIVVAKPTPPKVVVPPVQNQPVASTQPLTFDNLDTARVRKAAYAEVAAGVQSSTTFVPNITFVLGPSLPQSRVDQEMTALNRASSFWSDLYQPQLVFVSYFTETDVDWIDNAVCSQAGYCPTGISPVISNVIRQDLPNCNSAMATRNKDGIPFFDQCLGTGSNEVKNRQTGPHEYTHWVQQAFADWGSTPNWWTEGSADYFGNTLGAFNGNTLPSQLDEMSYNSSYGWIRQELCPLANPTLQSIENCFKFTYGGRGSAPGQGQRWTLAHVSYYMGSLATEAMIAVKGLATFKSLLQDLKTLRFDLAFEKNYGISTLDFYPKVSKYVLAMYNQRR